MIKQNVRNMALFSTVSSPILALALLLTGTSHLHEILGVTCFAAAALSSLLISTAHLRAALGSLLFGMALYMLLPALPFGFVMIGAVLGGLLAWAVPFLFREEEAAC